MSRRYDCTDPARRAAGIAAAAAAVRAGELVVLPTDTVYGVGCGAFLPDAVDALLKAKGRGRQMPAPVLIGSPEALADLVTDTGPYGPALIEEFWPGALTLVFPAVPGLARVLGDAQGTVAVRMPRDELALELLREAGPMAVSSANLTGRPAARTAGEAFAQLGESVAVYRDGGPAPLGEPSSIVDLSGDEPRLLRAGALAAETLRRVCGTLKEGAG